MRKSVGLVGALVAATAAVVSFFPSSADAFLLPLGPAPVAKVLGAGARMLPVRTATDGVGDADYPSDTGAGDEPAATAAAAGGAAASSSSSASSSSVSMGGGGGSDATMDARAQLRDSLKCSIYRVAAKTNRGQLATMDQQNEMINFVAQLEALGAGRSPDPTDVEGRWELIYSDAEPFRASPFFMTVGKVMGASSLSPEDFFRLHRLATSGSEIGRVRQIITSTELFSEVEITTGVPSIPFAIKGTVVSSASAERTPEGNGLKLTFKSTSIEGSSLFSFLNGGNLPALPVADLAARVGLYPPSVTMTTYYVDANLRVSRTEDDKFFVFSRGQM